MGQITQIIKRDGRKGEFNIEKISASRSALNIGDNKNFTGTSLLLAIDISDIGDDESCI